MRVTRIILTQRQDDYYAVADGRKECGIGHSSAEAIGDLIDSHPEIFGLTIEVRRSERLPLRTCPYCREGRATNITGNHIDDGGLPTLRCVR